MSDTVEANDPTPDEPMLPVFSSMNHDAEMEVQAIRGVLDANGIPAVVIGPHVLPAVEFQVQVPEHMLMEARRVIAEAQAAGPVAADEAELAGERGGAAPFEGPR